MKISSDTIKRVETVLGVPRDSWCDVSPKKLLEAAFQVFTEISAPKELDTVDKAECLRILEARVKKERAVPLMRNVGYVPPKAPPSDNVQVLNYFQGLYADWYGEQEDSKLTKKAMLALVKNFIAWSGGKDNALQLIEFLFRHVDDFLLNIGKKRLSIYHIGTKHIVSSLIAWKKFGVWQDVRKSRAISATNRCETKEESWTPLQPKKL